MMDMTFCRAGKTASIYTISFYIKFTKEKIMGTIFIIWNTKKWYTPLRLFNPWNNFLYSIKINKYTEMCRMSSCFFLPYWKRQMKDDRLMVLSCGLLCREKRVRIQIIMRLHSKKVSSFCRLFLRITRRKDEKKEKDSALFSFHLLIHSITFYLFHKIFV
jgi:hypothetical protein